MLAQQFEIYYFHSSKTGFIFICELFPPPPGPWRCCTVGKWGRAASRQERLRVIPSQLSALFDKLIINNLTCMLHKGSQSLKSFLWNIDLFGSAQMLRYKNQTTYSTLTGGCLSLLIILVFGALLVQDSAMVFTKSSVIAEDLLYYLEDPTYTSFNFDDSSKFIFGVGISGLNLSDTRRYFDITLSTQVFSYGSLIAEYWQDLQPCKYEQWAHVSAAGAKSYDQLRMNGFLCPTPNVTVELQGKFTSETFKLLRLKIGKCKNETDPSRPCVSQSTVNKTSTYNMNYYFMNTYVNSGTLDPVGYYLQDRDYFGFTLDSTIVSNLYITENVISTDNSLLPWSSIDNETILLVRDLAEVKDSMNFPDEYINIYLRKSPYYILSERNFPKLQDLLSAIGGLFGFSITFLLIMQFYTQASFEIEMGDRLFYYNSDRPLKSGTFNFLYYILYCGYELLRKVNIEVAWDRMKMYYECREEVKEQLDLSLLMNKITFLEKCMNILFEEHQFRAIYLQQKPNVKEAEILRRNHGLNKIIHKNSKKINDKIQGRVKSHHEKLLKRVKSQRGDRNLLNSEKVSKEEPSIEDRLKLQHLEPHPESQGKLPYDLMQIVANFILDEDNSLSDKQKEKAVKRIEVISEQEQFKSDNCFQSQKSIELEDVTGDNHESLKFVNTALKDIKQIEEESKHGNVLSQRIYNQLNNDITKEQLMILKCLETIVANKPPSEGQPTDAVDKEKRKMQETLKTTQKRNMFQSLMRIALKPDDQSEKGAQPEVLRKENKVAGLMIELDTANRIATDEYL